MNANKQQQAIALLINLLAARPQRRKELMKQQFSFVATIRHENVIVAHGEFFMDGHPPIHEVVTTTSGVSFRDVDGGMVFVPFEVAPVAVAAPAPVAVAAPAPVAVAAPAPVAVAAAAPKLISTLSRRVAFGEVIEIRNALALLIEIFEAPSSGAIIQQLFGDGSLVVRFTGIIEKTWTI